MSQPRTSRASNLLIRSRRTLRPLLERVEPRTLLSGTFPVTTIADSGAGSFRQAILDADASPGSSTIAFQITGTGLQTISPTSPLPALTAPIFVNGYSQPGSSPNTLARGDNAAIAIALDGTNAGTNTNGLTIGGNGVTIQGLAIGHFSDAGISATNASNLLISGNIVGLDATGASIQANSTVGIILSGVNTSTIGGVTPSARNIVSGNGGDGIKFDSIGGLTSSGNLIAGNYVGTDATGTTALGNTYTGVVVLNDSNNTIGGTLAGAANVISGNSLGTPIFTRAEAGIFIGGATATGNLVAGNLIGTDATGIHGLGDGNTGVVLYYAPSNTIGGTTPAARNVISGNITGTGVYITGTTDVGNLVAGNYIGVDASGDAPLGNHFSGVEISYGGSNTIQGNVVSANTDQGIWIHDSAPKGNLVQGNLVGVLANGMSASNLQNGVLITANSGNTIGGLGLGAGNTIAYNVVDGVRITANSFPSESSTGNVVLSNSIYQNSVSGYEDDQPGISLQAAPTLTSVTNLNGELTIAGTVVSLSDRPILIQVYSAVADATGAGQGAEPIGTTTILPVQVGHSDPFKITVARAYVSGELFTATATNLTGADTSVFATNRQAVAFTLPDSDLVVTTTSDSGDGSLRDAILAADERAQGGIPAVITFAIPGTGPFVIAPATTLPTLVADVTLDGTTQPGYGTSPLIQLVGTQITAAARNSVPALEVLGDRTTIKGLWIHDWAGSGVVVQGNSNTVESLAITQIAQTSVGSPLAVISVLGDDNRVLSNTVINAGNDSGISIIGSQNQVGGATFGQGNTLDHGGNIYLQGSAADVEGNVILGAFNAGISANSISGSTIGSTVAGGGNLIEMSGSSGISINSGGGDTIAGNLIQGNGLATGNIYGGIYVANTFGGNAFTELLFGNTISGNVGIRGTGVTVYASSGIQIKQNIIFGNSGLGIDLGANGIASPQFQPPALVFTNRPILTSALPSDKTVTFTGSLLSNPGDTHRIEFFAYTSADMPGTHPGVVYLGSTEVTIPLGTNITTFQTTLPTSAQNGFVYVATATDETTNSLGTSEFSDPITTSQSPFIVTRVDDGINVIPGQLTLRQAINLVNAGNYNGTATIRFAVGAGNQVIRPTSMLPRIMQSVDIEGAAPTQFPTQTITLDGSLDPGDNGLTLVAAGNTVSGLAIVSFRTDGNVEAGNGLELFVSGNVITGNILGTDWQGTPGIGNTAGIQTLYAASTIGGTTEAARNVISGNITGGIEVIGIPFGGTPGLLIEGNNIGTTPDGSGVMGNGNSFGIAFGAYAGTISGAPVATVGGPSTAAGNVIVGNSFGLDLGETLVLVQGNFIGTDRTGTARFGNSGVGVELFQDYGSTIGGVNAGEGNVIAYNSVGVANVAGMPAAVIRGNAIFGNAGVGISLAGNEVPVPNLGAALLGADGLRVLGSYSGAPSSAVTIEFFANDVTSSSGIVQGQIPIGSLVVMTDASGRADFDTTLAVGTVRIGQAITATATTSATSEFSAGVNVTPAPTPPAPRPVLSLSLTASSPNVFVGDVVLYRLLITNSGQGAGAGTVVAMSLPDGLVLLDATRQSIQMLGGSISQSNGATIIVVPLAHLGAGTSAMLLVSARPQSAGTRLVAASATYPDGLSQVVATTVTQSVVSYIVENNADSGFGSLRQAILDANASGTFTAIRFNLPTDQLLIRPLTPLPSITVPVALDGSTQPGYAGLPLVVLDGANLDASAPGLMFSFGGSTVRGFVVQDFAGGGIELLGGGNSAIVGDVVRDNGGDGILLRHSAGNTMGGVAASDRLVIFANAGSGIEIADGSSYNVVQGSYLGMDATGLVAQGNGTGVDIEFSLNNTLGGNVLSGNFLADVVLNGTQVGAATSGNVVAGNLIGTDATGLHPATLSPNSVGVRISDAANNLIGGASAGSLNVISGHGVGVLITGFSSQANVIAGNRIGTDFGGGAAIPNGTGVEVSNAGSNTIGAGGGAPGNVISGNTGIGVYVHEPISFANALVGNLIGVDAAQTRALGNHGGGVLIQGAPGNLVLGNVIAGNQNYGVAILDATASGNRVAGNLVGSTTAGKVFGNGAMGVRIIDAPGTTLGGTTSGLGNRIAGNSQAGIEISGPSTSDVLVARNTVRDNGRFGVLIENSRTVKIPLAGVGANVVQANPRGVVRISQPQVHHGIPIDAVASLAATPVDAVGGNQALHLGRSSPSARLARFATRGWKSTLKRPHASFDAARK